jgi:transcriptional regulator with XRE-family HTH domain
MSLLEMIRSEIERTGVSQEVLAISAGISQSTLSRILDSTTPNPRPETLDRIAQALGILYIEAPADVSVDFRAAGRALRQHLLGVEQWIAQMTLPTLSDPDDIGRHYVDLTVRIGDHETTSTQCFELEGHLLIRGMAGSGKTTVLKRLAHSLLSAYPDRGTPILLTPRIWSGKSAFTTEFLTLLDQRHLTSPRTSDYARATVVRRFLEKLRATVLIDGLDEAPGTEYGRVSEDWEQYLRPGSGYRIFLSCRTGAHAPRNSNVRVANLLPISDAQASEYVVKRLGSKLGRATLSVLRSHKSFADPYPPLLLNVACSMARHEQRPVTRTTAIASQSWALLNELWDRERRVQRHQSILGQSAALRRRVVEALAFELTRLTGDRDRFGLHELQQAYGRIRLTVGAEEPDPVKLALEIESTTGVFQKVDDATFRFVNRALQEHLAASYLLKLPQIPSDAALDMPEEFAIATALSSRPDEYFTRLLLEVLETESSRSRNFLRLFLSRLVHEDVQFGVSEPLGWVILVLVAWYTGDHDPLHRSDVSTLTAFLSLSSVSACVHLALASGQQVALPSESAVIRVPSAHSIPEPFADFIDRFGDNHRLSYVLLSSNWIRPNKPNPS